MCLNTSPLSAFIATEFGHDYVVKHFPSTTATPTTTTSLNSTLPNGIELDFFVDLPKVVRHSSGETYLFDDSKVEFEDYRQGVKSWLSWQDSFILSNFILLALLSIGAIVAFKVNKR